MNTANPFQIPECFQKADLNQRRRERFKRGVMAVAFAIMALMIVLLIQGCMSERASVTPTERIGATSVTSHPAKNLASAPAQGITTAIAAPLPPAAAAPKKVAAASQKTETVYVVQPGDNLTHIAKLHGTTIKAIKAANDLANDRIFVGDKLKIPQA